MYTTITTTLPSSKHFFTYPNSWPTQKQQPYLQSYSQSCLVPQQHVDLSTPVRPLKQKEVSLYKTESCRNWTELGDCRYGKKCRYAHGKDELRKVIRHTRYKTQICRAYHLDGSCPYGIRCTFVHDSDTVAIANMTVTTMLAYESDAFWDSNRRNSLGSQDDGSNDEISSSSGSSNGSVSSEYLDYYFPSHYLSQKQGNATDLRMKHQQH